MNMEFRRKLPSPEDIINHDPLTKEQAQRKAENDREIRNIFTGKDHRLLLLIGPCSADREDAVLEYTSRLRKVQEKVRDKILIVPRIYTSKPRTTGEGYMGMLHQCDPNASPDLLRGLMAIRHLHVRVLVETGFSGADEMLYPENYRYLSDVLSYVAVGARSVENQQHRMVASGLDIPVGMKNPTGGDLTVMLNAIRAAQTGHVFTYCGWETESRGNPLAHAVLRGSLSPDGEMLPNYHEKDLLHIASLYEESGLQNPTVIVDTNHSNSGKHYEEQIRISSEILHSIRHCDTLSRLVRGLMIESYLEDGCQQPGDGVYGKSITDPCLGWEKTERPILEIAELR